MNDHDLNNLKFIRQLSDQGGNGLSKWLDSLSEDDFQYAMELLAAWERELTAEIEEFNIEEQVEVVGDFPDANQVLKQFRLTH